VNLQPTVLLVLLLSLPSLVLSEPLPEAAAHYRAGAELMKARSYRSAAREFEQASRLDSTYGEAFYDLGRAYAFLNQYPKAIPALEQAWRLGTLPERIPGELAELHHKSALKLYQQSKYPEAVAAFEQSVGLDSSNAEALFGLGRAEERLGRLPAARMAYGRALAVDPRSAKTHAALGHICLRTREYSSAGRAYEQAIAVDSAYMDAYGGLARVQIETEDLEGAVATLQRALQLDPKYADGYLYLGADLNLLGRWHEAVEPLLQAVALAPKNPETHYRLAEAYYGKGDYRLAIEAGQYALARDSGYHAAEVLLGDAHAKLGQTRQARTWYHRAVEDSRFREYCARRLEELERPGRPE
jgi:superkiller protein 3